MAHWTRTAHYRDVHFDQLSHLNELYQHHHLDDPIIDQLVSTEFKDWFKRRERVGTSQLNYTDKKLLKYHYWGPNIEVTSVPFYFVNGYNFQTERHNTGKSTMNCEVYVKSSSYIDRENDFYRIIEEIIQLTYPLIQNLHIVLFKCHWVDPVRGMKVNPRYHLVDVNFKKLYQKDDPFILAQQEVQVYFMEYQSMKRDKADWMAACKIKAWRVVDEFKWTKTFAYQSEKVVPVPVVATDNESCDLRDPNDLQVVVDLSMAQQ
ncbi:UNVERIFIED_CONTAM: hypothetical protein Sradi_6130700 [Sesamum radiatum]|uniref:DUF4216 domain-containing protein n=1 Tax=Sesamum radiatum TaxID=300843 RepID=A0AAW2KLC7_SESRA